MKHAGQVFLVRDEEVNYSKGTHLSLAVRELVGASSGEKPQARHSLPSQRLSLGKESFSFLPSLEDWSPVCMSKIIGPQALAEPQPLWCMCPHKARGPGPGPRLLLLCWHTNMEADTGPGFSMLPQSSPRKQPFLFCQSCRWVPHPKWVTCSPTPAEERPGLLFTQLPRVYFC